MPYKVNPANALCKLQDQGIQELNDTCFGICASFSESDSAYSIDPNCAKICENVIEKKKHELFGVGSCDHQVPYRPVIWNQYGRYFPKLLNRGMNPDEALTKCKKMCGVHSPDVALECQDKCILDYDSVEGWSSEGEMKDIQSKPEPAPTSGGKKRKNIDVATLFFLLCLLGFVAYFLYMSYNSYVKKDVVEF